MNIAQESRMLHILRGRMSQQTYWQEINCLLDSPTLSSCPQTPYEECIENGMLSRAGDGTLTRGSQLRMQIVKWSPLVYFRLLLEEPSPFQTPFYQHGDRQLYVLGQMVICFLSHNALSFSRMRINQEWCLYNNPFGNSGDVFQTPF